MGQKKARAACAKASVGLETTMCGVSDLRQTPVSKEYSCAGGSSCFEDPISGDKGQIVRACFFKASEVRNRNVWGPYKLSTHYIVDLSECDRSAWVRRHMGLRLLFAFCLRRLYRFLSPGRSGWFAQPFLNIGDNMADSRQPDQVLVRDLEIEGFLDTIEQFDHRHRIET